MTFVFGPWPMPSEGPPAQPATECVRCWEPARVDELGYCRGCHFAVQVEIAEGFEALGAYLRAWACFVEWCAQRGERIT